MTKSLVDLAELEKSAELSFIVFCLFGWFGLVLLLFLVLFGLVLVLETRSL